MYNLKLLINDTFYSFSSAVVLSVNEKVGKPQIFIFLNETKSINNEKIK